MASEETRTFREQVLDLEDDATRQAVSELLSRFDRLTERVQRLEGDAHGRTATENGRYGGSAPGGWPGRIYEAERNP